MSRIKCPGKTGTTQPTIPAANKQIVINHAPPIPKPCRNPPD